MAFAEGNPQPKEYMLLKNIFTKTFAFVALLAALHGTVTAAEPEVLDDAHPKVRAVMGLQKDVTKDFMAIQDVLGTAVGLTDDGRTALLIYVDENGGNAGQIIRGLPHELRGIPIKVVFTGKFHAFGKPTRKPASTTPTEPVSHTAPQSFPIQMGTSGGWRYDMANGYCCGGTLGSLVQVNGVQYILSNYHVLESDIVLGGNGLVGTTGHAVVQPGLIDVGCNATYTQQVGTLLKLGALPNRNVDVGLAQAAPGAVRTDGSILEIGTISSQTVGASLGKAVKKSGRTTGLTRSKVSALNATISVSYENECGGGVAFTKTFTGQIILANSNAAFLNSGDSGSLLVEDLSTNPRAIGLLYAGGSSTAVANPIGEVLSFIGQNLGGTASMVGK
jgi:hypothetical protein